MDPNKLLFFFITLFTLTNCKSKQEVLNGKQNYFKFDYFKTKEPFELEVLRFQQNTVSCASECLPYALLIGKTNSKSLPKIVTVLSLCDGRVFKKGEVLIIEPIKNPSKKTTLKPLYFVKDTLLNGKKTEWLLGSENKTIWGIPVIDE